jgi:hypothetical protein
LEGNGKAISDSDSEREPVRTAAPPDAPAANDLSVWLALSGATVLFVGMFLPIYSAPFVGQVNYFRNGHSDAILLAALAAAAAVLALVRIFPLVGVSGLATLALLAYSFGAFQARMDSVREAAATPQAEARKPLATLAKTTVNAIQIQWGWPILILGGILLVAADVRISSRQLSQFARPILGLAAATVLLTVAGVGGLAYVLVRANNPNGNSIGIFTNHERDTPTTEASTP